MSALLIAVLATFVTVAALTYRLGTDLERRAASRASLRLLAAYGDVRPGGRREIDPFVTRAIAPAVAWASRLGHRVSPAGYAETAAVKLRAAGFTGSSAVDRFLAARLGLAVLVVPLTVLFLGPLKIQGVLAVAVVALVTVCAFLGPDAVIARRAGRRQAAIRAALPEFLDLLTISVEAGLGFDQALDRIAYETTGPLAAELRRMRGETRAGASRAVALRAVAERVGVPELRSFVLAVQQAAGFGIPIGAVLSSQAEDMRVRWRQLAQERAMKAPVKMLVPTVFCVFPSLFVVIIGPAIVKITSSGL